MRPHLWFVLLLSAAGCGGDPFTDGPGDPPDAAPDAAPDALGAADAPARADAAGEASEASEPGDTGPADVLQPDDGPWSCNPSMGFFECGMGSGDTIPIGQVCAEQADGGYFGKVKTPIACGCTPTCACVLHYVNPCAFELNTPEYPTACTVEGGHMIVTCGQ